MELSCKNEEAYQEDVAQHEHLKIISSFLGNVGSACLHHLDNNHADTWNFPRNLCLLSYVT